jgi:hypothetical protein
MSILNQASSIVGGVLVGALLRLIWRQILVEQINYFINPLIKTIWGHVWRNHPEKTALTCPVCADKLYADPN